jgi:hypothetical protein
VTRCRQLTGEETGRENGRCGPVRACIKVLGKEPYREGRVHGEDAIANNYKLFEKCREELEGES